MVYIRDGIIGKDCEATVWLCNHAPYKVTVTKGTTIGQVTSDPHLDIQLSDIHILRTIMYNGQPQQPTQQVTDIIKVKQSIETLDLSIDTNLTKEQQEQLRELLLKYIDVFAINPQRPDVTHGIQHSINTGDQSPIKQYPRRVSPAMEELI